MNCDLCGADASLLPLDVPGGPDDGQALICQDCAEQLSGELQPNYWRCLSTAMWSEKAAVQVLSARLLTCLSDHDWARDLREQLWLDEETQAWVDAMPAGGTPNDGAHKDSNGTPLEAGDTVVLVKDLPVKGAGFTAKRGTAVRNISLVQDNPEHIEGRVEGQRIVILTKFVKRK
ncbi:PhnA protein [Epibacterium sp. SM1969]|uniref:PhnA protein n=1 Tax=Tritonibacter aquimaris TaxID=2663379 RepID=A0A844B1U1_9RHOB|nr:alkylphosphonate utilization protein [Tritonibacter aquimaris]MQY43356.1 PhnA protein [Tritonibacter aquimaris]